MYFHTYIMTYYTDIFDKLIQTCLKNIGDANTNLSVKHKFIKKFKVDIIFLVYYYYAIFPSLYQNYLKQTGNIVIILF